MILQTILSREEELHDLWWNKDFSACQHHIDDCNCMEMAIKSFHRQSIIAVLKAEIEFLKGEKKESRCGMTCISCDMDEGWEDWCECSCHKDDFVGFNQALDHTITHLTQIIKELEENV